MANPLTQKARERFGQNFLHDPQVIDHIIQVIHPQPGQSLVEIGPGQGAITLPLLRACKQLDMIELDRDLVQPLKNQAAGRGDLTVHQHDALRYDFSALAAGRKLRIAGNLPYNISTPLLLQHFHAITVSPD
jgi:16S rRNA (adenine1518-N6/adenine1519-N6)-dimethyltransferase